MPPTTPPAMAPTGVLEDRADDGGVLDWRDEEWVKFVDSEVELEDADRVEVGVLDVDVSDVGALDSEDMDWPMLVEEVEVEVVLADVVPLLAIRV